MSSDSPSESTGNRRNVAVTAKAQPFLEDLLTRFPFRDRYVIGQFACAYAIAHGVSSSRPADFGRTSGTNWSVATVDPDGSLADLILATYPDTTDPYVVLETLVSVGLLMLEQRFLDDPALHISDLLAAPS